MTANERAVGEVLEAYNVALNASDTNLVMPLYADDGVFMPAFSPPPLAPLLSARLMTRFLPQSS